MPTKNSEAFVSALGKNCKKCQKPTYSGSDGKLHHEQRANPADTGGRRAPAADPTPPPAAPPTPEAPPKRDHLLHRKVF